MNWKNDEEKKRGYTDATDALIKRMVEINLRQGFPLDKERAETAIARSYEIADLPIPRFDWRTDVTDPDFGRAAGAARAARAAGAAGAAGAAWAAWAAGAARAAGAAGADYDFDYFIDEFEYLQHEKGNEHDHKALAIYEQFLEARDAGLGYLADYETDGVCYLIPAPQVILDTNNQFHSDRQPSIHWKDGLRCYYLHGVSFPEDLWMNVTSRKMPFADILKIEDIDQRKQAMKYTNVWDFVKYAKGKEIDTHTKIGKDGRQIRYWLYKFPAGEIFDRNVTYAIYDDSMVGAAEQHIQGVPNECNTVAEAFAWKQSDDLYTVTPEMWLEMELDVHFT